jgi:hypothetical protein
MNKLKLWEAWRTSESDDKDKENLEEINNFLLEMKDELDFLDYKIDIDPMLEDCYNIKYHIICGLGFSVGQEDLDNLIKKDKSNLKRLNLFMEKSYVLLERLRRTNYKIAYFSIHNTYKGNNEIIEVDIRIKKMD